MLDAAKGWVRGELLGLMLGLNGLRWEVLLLLLREVLLLIMEVYLLLLRLRLLE
jgi:hypothetical protein